MGICASCLGAQPRDPAAPDEVESGPLLFSVPNGMHYGSFAEPQMTPQNNPAEAQRDTQRDTKALQRVVARTSDSMVDIYNMAPNAYPRQTHGRRRERQAQYQTLLAKLDYDCDCAWAAEDASLSMDEGDDADSHGDFRPIRADSRGRMVGSFREAAAAMA